MRRPRGQAAVETALTLPLVLFMILGALQLFMVLQARILAQYAASRAVRAGAMSFGDCRTMNDVAHLVLLPAIDAKFANGKYGPLGAAYAQQAQRRMTANQYLAERDADGNLDGPVVWLDRITPVARFRAAKKRRGTCRPTRCSTCAWCSGRRSRFPSRTRCSRASRWRSVGASKSCTPPTR
ncbi:MAG: pilus assembly protein [Archangiaceae bacterium]|nr:pilus assembly protein [Archangiaceae bacterium]